MGKAGLRFTAALLGFAYSNCCRGAAHNKCKSDSSKTLTLSIPTTSRYVSLPKISTDHTICLEDIHDNHPIVFRLTESDQRWERSNVNDLPQHAILPEVWLTYPADVEELQKKKQSDVLRFLLRVRCWEVRRPYASNKIYKKPT